MKRHMETAKHKRGLESLAMQSGIADIMAAGQKRTTMVERPPWQTFFHEVCGRTPFVADRGALRKIGALFFLTAALP